MTRALRVAYTIGLILLLYFVAIFGVKAFYPEQSYYDYNAEIKKSCGSYPEYETPKCTFDNNRTVEESEACNKESRAARERNEELSAQYYKCSEKYNPGNYYKRNLFIIENIVGLLFVIAAFFLLRVPMLSNGFAFAGILLISDGFYEGWRVAEKTLQFGISLTILIIFIITATALHKRTK